MRLFFREVVHVCSVSVDVSWQVTNMSGLIRCEMLLLLLLLSFEQNSDSDLIEPPTFYSVRGFCHSFLSSALNQTEAYSLSVTALTLAIHLSLSVGMTYSCPLPVYFHPSFSLSLVKTAISWPQFKCRHDSGRCHLTAFSFSHLPLSPSLSGDRLTPWGAWHDRFRCHLTATWPSATPPRSLAPSLLHALSPSVSNS